MNRDTLLIGIGLLLCLCRASAQTAPPPLHAIEDVDRFLAGSTLKECQGHFHECEQNLSDLQEWAGRNYPIGQRLAAENEQLRARAVSEGKAEVRLRIFIGFGGVGFGLFFAWATVKAIRRWWPSSKQRRQLITLLLMAAWVTVVAAVGIGDSALAHHPINLAVSVFVYSIPALAFGGVGVWWFGRTKPEILW